MKTVELLALLGELFGLQYCQRGQYWHGEQRVKQPAERLDSDFQERLTAEREAERRGGMAAGRGWLLAQKLPSNPGRQQQKYPRKAVRFQGQFTEKYNLVIKG